MMSMHDVVDEVVKRNEVMCCDRALFAIVNRSLNDYGYQALITNRDDELIWFRIGEIWKEIPS